MTKPDMRPKPVEHDLTQAGLDKICPGLSLAQLGRLADPPLDPWAMNRLRLGRGAMRETHQRLNGAIERAKAMASNGELQPTKLGRPLQDS